MARNEFEKMTPEQRRENGRKGGIASGEAKRKKKAMRERLEILLELPMRSGKGADLDNIKNFAALKGKNITVQDAMMIAQIQKALKGDTTAAAFVRDTAGENPAVKVEADVDMDLNITIDYGDEE
jgi:glutamate synthase domain-containing protein 1